MNIDKSPQRILRQKTWYLCLLALLFSVAVCSAAPLQTAPGHWHRKHSRWSRHSHFRNDQYELGAYAPPQIVIQSEPSSTTQLPVDNSLALNAPSAATSAAALSTSLDTKRTAAAPKSVEALKTAAPKPQIAPLDMTRDADGLPIAGQVHDAGSLDVTAPIIRMLGSLLLVVLIILGSVNLLRRFNLIPPAVGKGNVPPKSWDAKGSPNPLIWMAARKPAPQPFAPVVRQASPAMPVDNSSPSAFELISSLNLPGNSASVHLVQASGRLLVLGSSPSTGLTLLTEIAAAGAAPAVQSSAVETEPDGDTEDDDEAFMAFADILREKAGLPARADRQDFRALDQVDARLTATQERLNARLNAGAELSSATKNITPASTRRRTPKAAPSNGREL